MMLSISMKFPENAFILNDCVTDGQTDGQTTEAQQYVSIPVRGRHNKDYQTILNALVIFI